ncbi:MAG: ATP-binding cassette domain-containing protein [Candidatus Accumulibacter sp.]|jgi:ABC-type nitrate/sulfonate/bicarbonate transport system ATPase subunit|nr:ATP-binding cassette domain-containing protein [Accumulibacter sp.]
MLILSRVRFAFAHHTVLHDITLDVREDGINCLLGASGGGKSTLLRVTAGLLVPDEGTVHITPEDCAVVFQDPRLLPWLTVEENLALALPARLERRQRDRAVAAILEEVQLAGLQKHLPDELSGGMAQRVGLARALLRRPRFLLMDEPFAALDAITRSELQQMLLELIRRQRVTCLFVTHDINEALAIGDAIFVLRGGCVAERFDTGDSLDPRRLRERLREQLLEPPEPEKVPS